MSVVIAALKSPRIPALLLLVLVLFGLATCELIAPSGCELVGSASDNGAGDACLCCCFHVVVETPILFEPNVQEAVLDPLPVLYATSVDTLDIYHPPQA